MIIVEAQLMVSPDLGRDQELRSDSLVRRCVRGVEQIPWTASAYRRRQIYILFGDGMRLMAYYYYEMIPAYAVSNITTHVKQLDLCHHSSFKTQQSVSKSN